MIKRATAQHDAGRRQMHHRRQQLAIAETRRGLTRREQPMQHQDQQHHGDGRHDVHHVPGRDRCDEAGHRSRQHHADHQPGGDVADGTATRRGGRQMSGIGNEDLHGDRAKPDEHPGDEKRQRAGRIRGRQRASAPKACDRNHQPPVLDEIAERHDQQETRPITELRHGHDEAGRLGRQPQIRADRANQRLSVVEIGDDQPTGHRKQ